MSRGLTRHRHVVHHLHYACSIFVTASSSRHPLQYPLPFTLGMLSLGPATTPTTHRRLNQTQIQQPKNYFLTFAAGAFAHF